MTRRKGRKLHDVKMTYSKELYMKNNLRVNGYCQTVASAWKRLGVKVTQVECICMTIYFYAMNLTTV